MSQSQPAQQPKTPDVFMLQKMQAHELTDENCRIYCDGQFFPISIVHGIAAGEYDQPIYRLTEVETATAANNKHAAQEQTA